MSSIGHIPPGGGFDKLSPELKPAQVRREPAQQQISKRPVNPPTRSVPDGNSIGRQSLSNAASYARGAAQVLPESDPLKGFAKGLSSDLAGAKGEIFASAGRLGALHNAHSFALVANEAMQGSSKLQAIA